MHSKHDDPEHLLRILSEKGQLHDMLDVLHRMDTVPSINTYLTLLKTCIKFKALTQAHRIHAHLAFHNVPLSGLLGDYMVVTLAKCGAIDDAKQLHVSLSSRTVFSWNAIISACVEFERSKEALDFYHSMQEDGVEPSNYTFVSLFKACGNIMDLSEGRKLHKEAREKGYAADVFICSTLISMYGKCGDILGAESVFSELSQRCVVSWNAMLSAYLEQGKGETAIKLFRQMIDEGVSIDQHTYVFAVRACSTFADSEKNAIAEGLTIKLLPFEIGCALHVDIHKKGFTLNVHVGTTLLSMYGKCGDIVSAETVFGQLISRNVVSWNAMLSAYVEHGEGEKALSLYRQMHWEGLRPHELTYVLALQACGIFAEKNGNIHSEGIIVPLEIGHALHEDAQRKGLATNACVGTALLSMYGKCGAVVNSEDVFNTLSQHDVVAWNAMLTVYLEQGNGVKALKLYMQMQIECRSTNHLTLVLALQACGTLGGEEPTLSSFGPSMKTMYLEIGLALHADARRSCFTSDLIICNTLISMYGKCGAIEEAEHVCGALSKRNIVTGNAMLSTYVDCGQGEKALLLYKQLQNEGLSPGLLTIVIALQACGLLAEQEQSFVVEGGSIKLMSLQIGQALHSDARMKGFASHPFVGTALLSMYAKCGAIAEAESMFTALSERDVVSWNALLSVYVEQGQGTKALQLYRQMQGEGPEPCQLTFSMALQACSLLAEKEDAILSDGKLAKEMCLDLGKALHADANREGYASEMVVGNTLMSMYGKCGALVEAEDVFHAMPDCNIVSWNILLSTCVEQGRGERAFWIYRQIQKQGVVPDDVTITCMLQACTSTGSLRQCKQIHFSIVCAGCDQLSSVSVTLIHAYGSCASMLDAHAFFDEILKPDIVSWNACISGYAGGGSSMTSLQMFANMRVASIAPDEVTFTSVLSACTHAGLVAEGLEYFESLSKDNSMVPDFKHFGSMVDLLGRAGNFKRVQYMLKRLPRQANSAMWLCLLGACKTHGNLELGEEAFDNAVNVQPEDATAYVMMSNVYANVG